MIIPQLNLSHNQKYLVGCSGGPDSILLLHILKMQKYDIIACHVNYHKRITSNRDQKIMIDFCQQNKIEFQILEMNQENYSKYKKINNFQNKARKIRYDFFRKVADENNINSVCIGHHRDDFLETAIWQEEIKKTQLNFYGIKESINLFGLNIFRPLMNYYKTDILEYLDHHDIKYGIDESNNSDNYTRNKIRHTLSSKTLNQKNMMIKHYQDLNKKLAVLEIEINNDFIKWQKNNFEIDFINNVDIIKRKRLIFKYIYNYNLEVSLSESKLNSICDFLLKKDHRKMYRIGSQIYLTKKRNFLAFISKK